MLRMSGLTGFLVTVLQCRPVPACDMSLNDEASAQHSTEYKENVQRSEAQSWKKLGLRFGSSSTGWCTWPDDLVSLDLVRKWSPMMASRLRAVRALFPS